MSVKELSLDNGYVIVKRNGDKFIPCAVAVLDRSQAHLLMLYLQEHLK